ncbi:leucyl/phenylalanyl-tRNA--protein transferase [Nonlabens marinus]|uniref:Leucyl/phenylalanyl-tRNA--protein transferase n=1 Tax=Nonlabens marinus S1-08 TaxID=1454201 RepID=W8VQE3_9FLAO|nr:leucyl/phenylalanyl-tRNA--protein transferase [Nonlabens marinus]BAO55030.1 leucyl/phenylalanyl-tRNA--protein transferase [Nonlabens marinus S1-08]
MYLLDKQLIFPNPNLAPSHGMLAIGGDLSVERLLLAYKSGIFPWYNDGEPICWWSPDPRMVFDLSQAEPMKISKSLRQSQRNRGYEIRENTSFEAVMRECMNVSRSGEAGTWINEDLIAAYLQLHKLGHAKSVEVFQEDILVGGLYGVDLSESGIFCGESMFSKSTDASKVALMYWTEQLKSRGYRLIDAQLYNDHLASLGAVEIDREVFLSYLQ